MRGVWKVVLGLLLGLPALAGAQPCNSTQGQLEICKGITSAVRWGFPRYTTALLPACTTANKGAGAFNTTTGTVQVCSGSAWGDVGPAGSGITSLNGLVAGTQLFAAPAAGLTITSLTDTHTFALANDLAALEGISTTGVAVRTGTSTWTTRTITGTANQIAVADGDGVAGAPTLSISPVLDLTSKTLRVPNSTTLPATCTVGDSYMDTDATSGARWYLCESTNTWAAQGGGGGGAPTDATYITQTANGSLSAEQALGALATGCLGSATTTGVVSARTVTGTSNEVSVANGDCSGNPTISLPATIDLGGKTSFEIPNAAAPTTDAFGEIAGDNDAWAASRGAVQFFDGTANTYLVGALASDTPSNGQVPTWNTGGTVTWETPSAGGITIGDTQVAYATAANTVGGDAGMTYNSATDTITLAGDAVVSGGDITCGAAGQQCTISALATAPANGLLLQSATAATAGTDYGVVVSVTGDLAAADRAFCVGDNASTSCNLAYIDGTGSLTLNSTNGVLTSRGVSLGNADSIKYGSQAWITGAGTGEIAFTSTSGTDFVGLYFGPKAGEATPSATTIYGAGVRGGTDSNTAGASLTIQPGIGTGNSVPAILMLKTGGLTPTSGTTAQTPYTRLGLGASKVLTNNSAIGILNHTEAVTSATVGGIGGSLDYCIEVVDGTDVQQECGNVVWSGVNKAGAFTNNITEVSTQSVSAGTLATTWAISSANPALISINANSSLTPSTGFPRITYNYRNLSQQSIAVQ